jgi:hypothetical protein
MSVTLRIKPESLAHVQDLFAGGLGARPIVRLILKIQGPVASRAFIWEFGRITCKPGPKTLWGTNPDGERRVMTKTAPTGFIRVNRSKYRQIAHDEIQKRLKWRNMKIKDIPKAIEWGLRNAASPISQLIADTAPYDTGALYRAILAATQTFSNEPVAVDMLAVRTRANI